MLRRCSLCCEARLPACGCLLCHIWPSLPTVHCPLATVTCYRTWWSRYERLLFRTLTATSGERLSPWKLFLGCLGCSGLCSLRVGFHYFLAGLLLEIWLVQFTWHVQTHPTSSAEREVKWYLCSWLPESQSLGPRGVVRIQPPLEADSLRTALPPHIGKFLCSRRNQSEARISEPGL